MKNNGKNWFIIIYIAIISLAPLVYFLFFHNSTSDFSNVQEISDSGITLVYTGKDKNAKICFVKYYDETELPELAKNLGENDIIYLQKDTPIPKSFFDSLKDFDYSIKFPQSSAKILWKKNCAENN